ncbi:GAP family protein [Solirubrobacter taibaiensis]|nr:GAP family protein [Solirubrobacter taibaiensis]
MSLEVLILGLISAVRPATSQAAVLALLRSATARRSLLTFTLTGFVVSVGIGLVVVIGFGGAQKTAGESTFAAVFDLVAGVAALGFAVGVQRGRLTRPRPRAGQGGRTAAVAERLRNASPWAAALAGVATHVPGLLYLIALNAIAAGSPSTPKALWQVGVYNALWFSLPVAALVLAIRSPAKAGMMLDSLTAFARAHEDRLIVVIFGGVGLYLSIKGIAELA